MSNIYVHEPPTNGTVRLITSVGDIDIELWSKEAPKACKNFVQLCLDGFYNNTIFHRLIPGFIVQGGDPKGDGRSHGESIYGKPYLDEFHSRLRFVRRGLVGLANTGPNDNTSHFFFTLGATPELNNKNTIFAKIGGDTIYNMLKLADGDTDKDDRPISPHKIISTKVLDNPFPDIVSRIKEIKSDITLNSESKVKSKSVKNFSLLSFGEEAEEEENESIKINNVVKLKGLSSHDLLNDSKLSSKPAVTLSDEKVRNRYKDNDDNDDDDESDNYEEDHHYDERVIKNDPETSKRVRDKMKRKFEENEKNEINKKKAKKISEETKDTEEDGVIIPTVKDKIKELRKEASELRKELKKEKITESNVKAGEGEKEILQSVAMQEFEASRSKYETLKGLPKKGADRENATLLLLQKFQGKLETVGRLGDDCDDVADDEKPNRHEEDDDNDDNSWLSHKLSFEEEAPTSKVKDVNVVDSNRYELFDPRNSMNKRRRKDDHKDHHKDHPNNHSKDHHKDHYKDHSKDDHKDHPKDHSKDDHKDNPKDHSKDHHKDYSKNHSNDHSKDHQRDHHKDRHKDHSRDHSRDHNDDRSKEKNYSRR